MARALECPACGAKRRIANLPDQPTFRCDGCGQMLTVPRPTASEAAPVAARVGGAGDGPIAPPPRRPAPGAAPIPAPDVVGAVSATLPAAGDALPPVPSRRERAAMAKSRKGDSRKARAEQSSRGAEPWRRVSWYWRILAWVLAVPLGFLITAYPAYHFKLIRKDDMLDVFVGSGTDRYARLAVGTVVWALVTALLVQLFVEGGRWWMARRRTRQVEAQPSAR